MSVDQEHYQWYKKSEDDLLVARHVFNNMHPRQLEIACYHSQQAAEKALKGFLVLNGMIPPLIHDLVELCEKCAELSDDFSKLLTDCAILRVYATATRYPSGITTSEDQTLAAIEKAERIYNLVLSLTPKDAKQSKESQC
ncbi:MAG: HEPN domain-containing protein [Clostridiales bacterium]|jgi:HEPN domain-containing protein|nr:HEPN domain-containing protein [Clostridiales bacterium]